MRTFQSRALALSRCSLEVVLPSTHIFLPSKEVYESLYNRWRLGRVGGRQASSLLLSICLCWARPPSLLLSICPRINNDLLMWEPADLLPAPDPAAHPPGFPGPSGFWHDNFKMCKSAFKLGRKAAPAGVPSTTTPQSWTGLGQQGAGLGSPP